MKKDNEKRVPELRFKGFDGDWEQRKWSDVINISNDMVDPRLPRFKNLRHIGPGNIEPNTGRLFTNIHTVSEDGLISGKFQFKSGDIIYSKIRPHLRKFAWPKFQGLASADTYILNSMNSDVLTQGFIFCIVQSSDFYQYSVSVSMRTGMPKINREELGAYHFFAPSVHEQGLIVQFETTLDSIVALHERKLNLLKRLKKAYLQQLFPENEEKTPSLRFAGYADDWELRKSATLFKSISIKKHPELPVLSASQQDGMVLRDKIGIDIKYDANSLSGYKLVRPGQFVIHLRSFQGGFAFSKLLGITSPAYTVLGFQSPADQVPEFWREVLTSSLFIQRLETVTYGIRDGRSISFNDFGTLSLTFPTVDEQKKIARFLEYLDDAIALHHNKLEMLQELKKAYLQKLFI